MEPAKLRGVESEGMLLAADDTKSNKVVLLQPEKKVDNGTALNGFEKSGRKITFPEFQQLDISVSGNQDVLCDGVVLIAGDVKTKPAEKVPAGTKVR